MLKKIIKDFFQLFVFAFIFYAALCLFPSCAGTGAIVSDIGIGASEYREVQTQQRERETELAVTGARIELESREIRAELNELERSIIASKGTEQELGEIIQRIRAREIDPAFIEEWRNRGFEERSSK